MNYQEFLQTPFWTNLRAKRVLMDGGKCAACQTSEFLQVHHKFYRKNWFETMDEDLITLCANCHKMQHRYGREFTKYQRRVSGIIKKEKREKIYREKKAMRKMRKKQQKIAAKNKFS